MSPKTQIGALNCGAYGTPVRPPFLCYYPVVVPSRRIPRRKGPCPACIYVGKSDHK